jgi:hypothetical protein
LKETWLQFSRNMFSLVSWFNLADNKPDHLLRSKPGVKSDTSHALTGKLGKFRNLKRKRILAQNFQVFRSSMTISEIWGQVLILNDSVTSYPPVWANKQENKYMLGKFEPRFFRKSYSFQHFSSWRGEKWDFRPDFDLKWWSQLLSTRSGSETWRKWAFTRR